MLSRRSLMGMMALTLASASVQTALARGRAANLSKRLGLQLYMVGADLDADLPGTLKALADIGYREVEVAGLHGRTPEQMRAKLDRAGLVCTSCHLGLEPTAPGEVSLADPSAAIALLKSLGATNAVAPSFPFMRYLKDRPDASAALKDPKSAGVLISDVAHSLTADDWIKIAGELNRAGAQLAPAGIRVGYHNHNIEFVKFPGGQTAHDLLIAHSDPKLVDFELDVGWAAAAGEDPVALLKRHRARIAQLHLKDVASVTPNTNFGIAPAVVGRGVLPWSALLGAIPGSAVRHAYIEEDPPFSTSPLKAAANSYAFMAPLMARLGV